MFLFVLFSLVKCPNLLSISKVQLLFLDWLIKFFIRYFYHKYFLSVCILLFIFRIVSFEVLL